MYISCFFRVKSSIDRCAKRFLYALCGVFLSFPALAQLELTVNETRQGYELEINFSTPLRHLSHTPTESGHSLNIQLQPEGLTDRALLEELAEHRDLSWDKSSGIPLQEIIYDAGIIKRPNLILNFTRKVNFTVKNSSDLRSLLIYVEIPGAAESSIEPEAPVNRASPIVKVETLILALKETDPKMAELLDQANQAMLDKNYNRAVQLFTKIRDLSNDEVRRYAQELLGLARQSKGQLAHAKAEYKKYLQDYPESDGAERVNQRLMALLTASEVPKKKLKPGRRQSTKAQEDWNTQFYGSFSQTYFRDEMMPEDGDTVLLRSDLSNDLDFVARARKGDYDLRAQFVGSYREDMRSDGEDGEFLPSIMSFDLRDSGRGLYARLGRQSRTTGGILGRFDGIHASYEVSSRVTLNTVFGYPVDTRHKTKIDTGQEFYGLSADVGGLWEGWDFNAFYITQDNSGIKDREAVGGEVRYFDTKKSFFTLVDYDILYDDLNIFLFIGSLTVREGTTLNLVVDYRNSPILTTTNAVQGQGVEELDELSDIFTDDDLERFAEDRTAESKSITTGVTQRLNDTWQLIGELTVTEFGDTEASGGVEALEGTGKEYYYSSQFIASNLFYQNDSVILSARYADTLNSDTYTLDGNWRINLSRKFRLNPRMRFDYRESKQDDDSRWFARPSIKIDYRLKKWMKLEFELGYEWLDETFGDDSAQTSSYFVSLGYRAQF